MYQINSGSASELESKRTFKPLPLDFFPDFWANDVDRMGVLFNTFRPENVNLVNYKSKMKFWKMLILKYCNEMGNAMISEFELKNAFTRNGRKPMCLSTVLQDMENNHEIETLSKFKTSAQLSWKEWAIDVIIKRPLSWGWNNVKNRIFQSCNEDKERRGFIVLEIVKKHGELLQIHNVRGEILILNDVVRNSIEIGLSAEGVEYALHYLKKSQQIHTATIELNVEIVPVIKFAEIGSETNITDYDKAVFILNQLEQTLTKRTAAIESQIHQMNEKVRQLVREKKRDIAKNYLKMKKMMVADLDRLLAQFQHISAQKTNIENAKYNAGVVEAYKMGAKTLKEIYDENGLTVDKVRDVMREVQQTVNDHNKIQNILDESLN